MYISAEQIRQRGEEYGLRTHHTSESLANMSAGEENDWANVERELEREHMERIFEVWDEALEFLADEPRRDQIVIYLLKGWCDDEDIEDSCICFDDSMFFNDWEVSRKDSQWMFEHTQDGTVFWDIDLLSGLDSCDTADSQLESLVKKLSAELKPIQVVRLNQIIRVMSDKAQYPFADLGVMRDHH